VLTRFHRRFGRWPMPGKISGACDYKAGQPDSKRQPQALMCMIAAILQPTLKPSMPGRAVLIIGAFTGGNPCQTAVFVAKDLHADVRIHIERLKHARKSVLQRVWGHNKGTGWKSQSTSRKKTFTPSDAETRQGASAGSRFIGIRARRQIRSGHSVGLPESRNP